MCAFQKEELAGVSPLPATPRVVGRAGSHCPFWDPDLLCSPSQLLPSALSAGLWEVPTTEAVYSGVHPRLERAQCGDGSGEEVHSEVGFPAGPPPHLAYQPALLSTLELLTPLMPGEKPLVFRGPEHLIFGGQGGTWVLPTTCDLRHLAGCVTLSQLLYLSGPVYSTIHRGCCIIK